MTEIARDGVDVEQELLAGPRLVVRSSEEQLHEVRASLAGLARAVRLLVGHAGALPEPHKRRIEILLESEVCRLERLLFEHPPIQDAVVVADVIAPVVDARRLAGQVVHWQPSPARALCVQDFLAEAVNILLSNAAKHAGGSPAVVEIADSADYVQVRVSDRGPGIPRLWRHRVFDRGFRGGDVDGHGLGLEVARRLMAAQDGWLHLEDSAGPGATFVLSLSRQRHWA